MAFAASISFAETKHAGTDPPKRQQLQFYFVDGRVLAAEVDVAFIDWVSVSIDGKSENRRIRLAEISQLILTESPAAKQIAVIRQLVESLASDDYHTREAAEAKLSDPDFAAPYYELIANRVDDPRLELRYRLRRILAALDQDRIQAPLRFDKIVLKNGEELEGDAGVFEWSGEFLGRTITIRRNELTMLSAAANRRVEAAATKRSSVDVKLFFDHMPFGEAGLRIVDFSTDPNGNQLARRDSVNDVFVPWGLRFTPQGKGYIGIPGFSFSSEDLPVGQQSIARFNDTGRNGIPYKGVIEFEFCVPNQPSIPAGVRKFGTFIATVDSPRSFVIEGFDVDGDLVALVESPATKCGFIGFESSKPIHRIQIRSNPYLYRIDGNVDDDFALDTFHFSTPEQISLPAELDTPILKLTDGTRLTGKISFSDQGAAEVDAEGLGKITIPFSKVAEVSFGRPILSTPKLWFATIDDGSVLQIEPTKDFLSKWMGKLPVQSIVAIHNSSNPKRFPLTDDFEKGQSILVYPTCRIAVSKLQLSRMGFRWPNNSEKLLQPVDDVSPLGVPGKDPTPQVTSVDFQNATADEIPTAWLSKPKTTTGGYVRLIDGQRISLNSKREIKKIDGDMIITIEGTREIRIPLNQVSSLKVAN